MESQIAVTSDSSAVVREISTEKDYHISEQFIDLDSIANSIDQEVSESKDKPNLVDDTSFSEDSHTCINSEAIDLQSVDTVTEEIHARDVDNIHETLKTTPTLPDSPNIDDELLHPTHDTVQNVSGDAFSNYAQSDLSAVDSTRNKLEGDTVSQLHGGTKKTPSFSGSVSGEPCINERWPNSDAAEVEIQSPSSDVVRIIEPLTELIDSDLPLRLSPSQTSSKPSKEEDVEALDVFSFTNSNIEPIVQEPPSESQFLANNKVFTEVSDSSRKNVVLIENQDEKLVDNSKNPENALDVSVEDCRQTLEQVNLDESNDKSESESVCSIPCSVDETFDKQTVRPEDSDDDILPGARRPRHSHSDDEDDDDDTDELSGDYNSEYDDEDLVDSEHTSDNPSYYSDAEDSQPNRFVNKEPSDEELLSSPREKGSTVSLKLDNSVDHFEGGSSTSTSKEVELDADQDKTNPAYIPRTGRYFMHDSREADHEELQESTNEVKSIRDTKRWKHDRFCYRDQAPLSTEEIIRKYGYDIRSQDSCSVVSGVNSEVSCRDTDGPRDSFNRPYKTDVLEKPDTLDQHGPKGRGHLGSFTHGVEGNRGRARGEYRSTQSQIHSLRGRFTINQRSFYATQRGRSDDSGFNQPNRSDVEANFGRHTQLGYSARRANNIDPTKRNSRRSDYKNIESHSVTDRKPRYDTNSENSSSTTVQWNNRPSYGRSFTRLRGTIPRNNTDFPAVRGARSTAQSRRQGSNQLTENVALSARDDHKPCDQGPKRYSTLRQTMDHQPNKMLDEYHSHPNTVSSHQTSQRIAQNYNTMIDIESHAFGSKRSQYTPITDNFVNPMHFNTEGMRSLNRIDPSCAPIYNQGPNDDSPVLSQAHHSNLSHVSPANMYPMQNIHAFPEEVPLHPYVYQHSVDPYQFAAPDGTYQQYDSAESRERRPVLGRRPLKPLEVTDPRERCQSSTAVGVDQIRKGGLPQELWSKPTPELASQNT